MIALPAVDLRGGRCVQLVGGKPDEERVSLPDPLAIARRWREIGFTSLHIVDLDAALGEGDNREIVRDLCSSVDVDIQMGGGLRDEDAVSKVLGAGANRVVVGTRAIDDRPWLEALAERFPFRVVVAADIRDDTVLRKGWTESSDLEVTTFLRGLADIPLGGVLCTDVGREGRMAGIDEASVERVIDAAAHPVWISGGIASIDDLEVLSRAGAEGAVLGMSLYTERLNAAEVAARFGSKPETVGDVSSNEDR